LISKAQRKKVKSEISARQRRRSSPLSTRSIYMVIGASPDLRFLSLLRLRSL
jgi:hypothetical protein